MEIDTKANYHVHYYKKNPHNSWFILKLDKLGKYTS